MSERWRNNFYIHPSLDRAAARREQFGSLPQLPAVEAGQVVLEWRGRTAFVATDITRSVLVEIRQWAGIWSGGVSAFLGQVSGTSYWLADLSDMEEGAALELLRQVAPAAEWAEVRRFVADLAREEASLLAYARGIAYWQRRHRFCGACGAPTRATKGGHVLSCTNAACGIDHFPRTDPAVIMLVEHGERALFGRHANWPGGRYSTLAGFVEPGESLEQAVIREVAEEAGVSVGSVRYHSSQPWPFPASVMVGFIATATSDAITVDHTELEDARWFTRAEVRQFPELGFSLSSTDSIARRLIEDWLAEG